MTWITLKQADGGDLTLTIAELARSIVEQGEDVIEILTTQAPEGGELQHVPTVVGGTCTLHTAVGTFRLAMAAGQLHQSVRETITKLNRERAASQRLGLPGLVVPR